MFSDIWFSVYDYDNKLWAQAHAIVNSWIKGVKLLS